MSRELTDTEARDHYRDELNRTRIELRALTYQLGGSGLISVATVRDAILRILGERP